MAFSTRPILTSSDISKACSEATYIRRGPSSSSSLTEAGWWTAEHVDEGHDVGRTNRGRQKTSAAAVSMLGPDESTPDYM